MTARPPAAASLPNDDAELEYPGWRRNPAFVWISLFFGIVGATFTFPFMPFFIQELDVHEPAEVAYFSGLAVSGAALGLILTTSLWGVLADRFGRKAMFVRALVGAGVGILFTGFCVAAWQVVTMRFITGVFSGSPAAASALVATSTPKAKMPQALGILQTASYVSSMLGPLMGAVVATAVGVRYSFFFCAGMYLVGTILAIVYIREGAATPSARAQKARNPGVRAAFREVLGNRQITVTFLVLFCLYVSNAFVRPFQPLTIQEFAEPIGGHNVVPLRMAAFGASLNLDLEPTA